MITMVMSLSGLSWASLMSARRKKVIHVKMSVSNCGGSCYVVVSHCGDLTDFFLELWQFVVTL